METVNSIMSTRRRSEDGGKEERRWSEDYGKEARRRSEDWGKDTWRRKEEGDDEIKWIEGRRFFTNGFNAKNHIIDECDDTDEDDEPNCNLRDFTTTTNHMHTPHNTQHPTPCLVTNALPNGLSEFEPLDDPLVSATDAKCPSLPGNKVANNDDFLSRYHSLMLSLGVEPDCDDFTDDIGTFRKRVRALWQNLEEEEEEGGGEEFAFSFSWDDGEEEGEEEAMEEEEEEEGEKGSRRHGAPFTGRCFQAQVN